MSLDELIRAANQLNENDLDQLLQQVVALRAQRKPHVLNADETQLLDKINQRVPTGLRAQYKALQTKKVAETLTEQEHSQLIQLSKQIEQFGAERLEALAGLAQLRQVSLAEIMEQLSIQTVSYV